MLKIGFLVPDDEGSELSLVCFFPDFLAADFTERSCPREKRSEVALGMFCGRRSGRRAEAIKKRFKKSLTNLGERKLSDNAQPPPPPTVMGILIKDLEASIRTAFPIIHLEIEDTSSGCGENYSVFIVSPVSPHDSAPKTRSAKVFHDFLGVRRKDNPGAA